jgi:MarR family transcriptional regulator, negative regulator of the multidrug operon emrRAB
MPHAFESAEGLGDGGLRDEGPEDDGLGDEGLGGPTDRRDANLLGALSLAVADRLETATRAAAAHGGSAPAALTALDTFLEGSSIDTMRRPLGLTHSAAVRLVDRLAGAGLVRRAAGEDGRSVAVFLTPAGRRAAAQVQDGRTRALAHVLAPLTAAERESLTRLHEKLLAGLTAGRADAGRICRLCDADACGHEQGRCPVTRAADRAEASRTLAS